MKRKRSVRMITKLLILSLILGLCLPSFTYQVNAAWLDDGYGLNGPRYINSETHQPDPSMGYIYNDESSEIKFNTVQPSTLGFEKYIMFYEANQGGDWTKDYGFFSEINIPLQSTESDSNKWNYQFEHFTFEKNRLSWNFSENPATDQMYITTDENGKIPVYIIGACTNYKSFNAQSKQDTKVTWESAQALNQSLQNLYSLVTAIEQQSEPVVNGYYPEHAELLKQVSVEARRIIFNSINKVPGYSPEGFITEANIADSGTKAIKRCKKTNVIYGERFFAGMKKIVDGYVDYVNKHKIIEPSITSANLDSAKVSIDNEKYEIIIEGKAEDYSGKSLSELQITLPDGVIGDWGDNTSFSDENITYQVWPYNENLGDTGKGTYKKLGQTYTVKFNSEKEDYAPIINVFPATLSENSKVEVTSYTEPSTKQTTYTVKAGFKRKDITDENGKYYAFSHWELDEDNRELESAKVYSDKRAVKVHNNTETMQSFIMPSKPLTITAVYKPAYKISTENKGIEEDAFALKTISDALIGWNAEEDAIELYYRNKDIPSDYIIKNIQVVTTDGKIIESKESTKGGTNYIDFVMPSSDVKVIVTFEKDMDSERKLIFGEASGTIIAGKGGTATYELTAEGYSEDATFTAMECYNSGIAKVPVTDGLTVTLGKVTAGKGTVTVTVTSEVAADEYYFCVTPSEGKKTAIGTITVLPADTRMLKAEDASITLKENESGEVKIKGSSMNLSAGASVEAFETNQDGQIKYSGKTEGLTFDKAVLNNDAFTLTAHVSKTVAKGEYYFIVKADNEQSAVAKLTVDREKAETPDQPDQPEKETQKITVTSNAGQGSIQIKVAGGSEELISGTGTVKAVEGDTVTVTAVPKDGYKLSAWKITQGMRDVSLSSGTLSDSSVSFVMPAVSGSDTVTVGATFDKTSTEPVETSEPKITAFSVANVSGTIDQESGTITVVVPNGTNVTSLCPAIAMSGADSVTPANGAAVNFTNSVTYTVKNASGVQKSYVVTVKVQEASVSDTLWDKITSPEGDRSWWKKADSIKSHKKSKYPKYW